MSGPAYQNTNPGCAVEFEYYSRGDTADHPLIPAIYLTEEQRIIELDHLLPIQESIWKKESAGIGRHKERFEVRKKIYTT